MVEIACNIRADCRRGGTPYCVTCNKNQKDPRQYDNFYKKPEFNIGDTIKNTQSQKVFEVYQSEVEKPPENANDSDKQSYNTRRWYWCCWCGQNHTFSTKKGHKHRKFEGKPGETWEAFNERKEKESGH